MGKNIFVYDNTRLPFHIKCRTNVFLVVKNLYEVPMQIMSEALWCHTHF